LSSKAKDNTDNLALQRIAPLIHEIRGERVILDSDLAAIYGVSTTRLNEQVKRNADRFPDDFAFRLNQKEMANLMSQFAISSSQHGGKRKPALVFTEHGAIMAANVLNSTQAVQMSLFVIHASLCQNGERTGIPTRAARVGWWMRPDQTLNLNG